MYSNMAQECVLFLNLGESSVIGLLQLLSRSCLWSGIEPGLYLCRVSSEIYNEVEFDTQLLVG